MILASCTGNDRDGKRINARCPREVLQKLKLEICVNRTSLCKRARYPYTTAAITYVLLNYFLNIFNKTLKTLFLMSAFKVLAP